MAQVKGVAILGLIKYIKKFHKNELDKIVKALPAESAKYMEEHILITEWYPYKLYTDLLRTYDRIIGKGISLHVLNRAGFLQNMTLLLSLRSL